MTADFTLYHRRLPQPTGAVVIAAIDEQSINEIGRWPWPRAVEARLIDALRDQNAAVIGFDMVFSENESQAADARFAQSMKVQKSTYIGYFFDTHLPLKAIDSLVYKTALLDPPPVVYDIVRKEPGAQPIYLSAGGYLPPIPELNRAAAGTAFLNINEDLDGLVRSYPTFISFNGVYCVPMFLALADAYLHHPPMTLTIADYGIAAVALGNRTVPVDESGRVTLHYRGPIGTIPRYSISDILNRHIPSGALAGKIIVIGVTAPGVGDRFATPVGDDFPGVEVLASAVDNALAGDFFVRSSRIEEQEEITVWALGIATILAAAYAGAGFSFVLMLLMLGGYLYHAMARMASGGVVVAIVLPSLTVVLAYLVVVSLRYIAEGRRGAFLARFLSPQLARTVLERGLADTTQQKRIQLSVVACDLRGFTSFAETAAPEDVMQFLQEYYETVGRVVTESGGSILNYAGDGIVALVGAPVARTDYAWRAVNIALEIWNRFREIMERWRKVGLQVGLGVGVASGFVTVGAIPSSDHLEYTAVGPAVNLAVRLTNRAESGQVLVDSRTIGLIGENDQSFEFESIGSAELKGFARPLEVFSARTGAPATFRRGHNADARRN